MASIALCRLDVKGNPLTDGCLSLRLNLPAAHLPHTPGARPRMADVDSGQEVIRIRQIEDHNTRHVAGLRLRALERWRGRGQAKVPFFFSCRPNCRMPRTDVGGTTGVWVGPSFQRRLGRVRPGGAIFEADPAQSRNLFEAVRQRNGRGAGKVW